MFSFTFTLHLLFMSWNGLTMPVIEVFIFQVISNIKPFYSVQKLRKLLLVLSFRTDGNAGNSRNYYHANNIHSSFSGEQLLLSVSIVDIIINNISLSVVQPSNRAMCNTMIHIITWEFVSSSGANAVPETLDQGKAPDLSSLDYYY